MLYVCKFRICRYNSLFFMCHTTFLFYREKCFSFIIVKADGKDKLVVLDFVANHQSFLHNAFFYVQSQFTSTLLRSTPTYTMC